MPCIAIRQAGGKRTGFLCLGGPIFDYDGFLFEHHKYCGPIPVRRDNHNPRLTIPQGFWAMWELFQKLPENERNKYQIKE